MKKTGYCTRCEKERRLTNGVEEALANGRTRIVGECPKCRTQIAIIRLPGRTARIQ